MISEKELTELAKKEGYSGAAILDVEKLTIVPAYRKYCEMNTCGMYGKHAYCPPEAGTVEELTVKVKKFRKALILQTRVREPRSESGGYDMEAAKLSKREHNRMTDALMPKLTEAGIGKTLRMSAGPWKTFSCMSAYCVDAQKMADACGMTCWADDGWNRYFSLVLFDEISVSYHI